MKMYHSKRCYKYLTSCMFRRPTSDLVRQLLIRQTEDDDMFVVTILRYWCRHYAEKLGELLATMLILRYPASPNKRKRTGAKNNHSGPPTGEQVLGHLDQLRQLCMSDSEIQLYQSDGMQKALQQAQAGSSDSLRKRFGDLFALAEVNEENDVPPPRDSSKKHATSNVKGHRKAAASSKERFSKRVTSRDRNSESSEQSSEVKLEK